MANMRPQQDRSTLDCISERDDRGAHGDPCYEFGSTALKTKLKSQGSRERFSHDLETEIIPRLMLAHVVEATPGDAKSLFSKSLEKRAQAEELAQLAIRSDANAVMRYIESSVSGTMTLDKVLVEIVAGAARFMGELWESDDLDFVEVTIGVSRLQQALRLISENSPPPLWSGIGRVRKAAFVPTQGEQHTFGLLMVGEAFRCAGWDVWGSSEIDNNALVKIAATEHIDLAGFSLSDEDGLDQLNEEIDTLRDSCRSAELVVLVGGSAFLHNPDLWKSTGADAMALDAIEALRVGEMLVKGIHERLP